MISKVIPYGTTHEVVIESSTPTLIVARGINNNEGFMLMFHGLTDLPPVGEKGTVTFVENNGPSKGHWKYESKNWMDNVNFVHEGH
jgi:hypothetical protein